MRFDHPNQRSLPLANISKATSIEATIRPDRAYSLDTAAKALTICTRTLSEQIKRGAIRAVPVGKRRKAVPGAEILRILAGESSNTNPST